MSLRARTILCPVLVFLFAAGVPLVVGRAPWPIPIRSECERSFSPWEAGDSAQAIFVATVVRVNGLIWRTVTLEVTETLKGEIRPGTVLKVEPGLIVGTESVGKRVVVYAPKVEHLTAGWRRSDKFRNALGSHHPQTAVFCMGEFLSRFDLPYGVELSETDAPLDLRNPSVFLGGLPESRPLPRRLIQHQRNVLTVQSREAPLTAEQVQILEDWLKPEFRYEAPGPWLIRDLLKPLAQEDQEAARLLEEYEALPW